MGKGTLYLMIAQAVIIFSGFLIHAGLGRILKPDLYGVFGVVFALTMTLQGFVGAGLPYGVTKFTAENENLAGAINKTAIKISLVFSITITFLYILFSDFIAELLKDPSLSLYMRISSLAIIFNSVYLIHLSSLNGLRKFKTQAKAQIFYAISRPIFIFPLVFLGFSISGAFIGYVIAIILSAIVARHYFGLKAKGKGFEESKIIKFALPIMIFYLSLNLIMVLDLLAVKALISESERIGYYTASNTLSKIPYFIFTALVMTLFPSITKASSRNDESLIKSYIKQSLRYLLILIFPVGFLISATSTEVVSLIYGNSYFKAGPSFSILIFGIVLLTIFMILNTIINGMGRPKVSMIFTLVLLPLDIILNLSLIPKYGLNGAAMATTLTALVGIIIAGTYVYRQFKTLMDPVSFVKISMASLVVFFIALEFSVEGILLPVFYALLFSIYFLILYLLKEIKEEDIKFVKETLRIG